MKHWLLAAALICFGSSTALAVESSNNVTQTCVVDSTSTVVTVSSQTPTALIADTTKHWRQISMKNLDSTAILYVDFKVNVSSQSTGNSAPNQGFPLAGGSGGTGAAVTFALTPGDNFYALNDSATASKRLWVGLCR